MESRCEQQSLPDSDDLVLKLPQNLDFAASLGDIGRTDEHATDKRRLSYRIILERDIGFKTVYLPTESVAGDFRIQQAEGRLLGPSFNTSRQQDHSRAGSVDRHSLAGPFANRFVHPYPLQEFNNGRALATRQNQGIGPLQFCDSSYFKGCHVQARQDFAMRFKIALERKDSENGKWFTDHIVSIPCCQIGEPTGAGNQRYESESALCTVQLMLCAICLCGIGEVTMKSLYDLDTPTLLVDADRLEYNIQEMAQRVTAGGKTLRPHTKTHKTPEIARMQTESGATGLTVAKLGEAEVMAYAGFKDIFIANQIVGPLKVARLMALLEHAKVRVGLDSLEAAEPLAKASAGHGFRLGALIEVDTGLGRAGTRSPEETLLLAQQVAELTGIEFVGIFTHEGHLYRGKDGEVDAAAAGSVAAQMREMAQALAAQGTPCREVSVGSTPGAALLSVEPDLTEMRPGVYVFNDRTQMRRGTHADRCALTVLATVTSVRSDGRIVVDAGTKSMASDNPFADKTYGEVMNHPELSFGGISEEHGHLLAESATSLRVGDKIRIVPNHACTCVNMHNSLTTVRGEEVEDTWYIAARGKIR